MSDLTERFCAEHFTLNGLTVGRQRDVRRILGRLESFLVVPIEEADDNALRAWQVSMLEDEMSPSTVRKNLHAVKPFYRWCWQARIINADQFERIREVAPPRGAQSNAVPRPYSRKQLAQMWGELDARWPYHPRVEYTEKRWLKGTSGWRNIKKHAMRLQLDAIVELALVCGLRRNEIYMLRENDVHPDNRYIVVHGKRVNENDKVRDVPYADSTREAVRRWFRMRRLMGAVEPCLWCSITGPQPAEPLTRTRMGGLLSTFGEWELHRLRHTCATERLRSGMKLEYLQRFLGHASIQQTLLYAQLVSDDIHKAADKTDDKFQRSLGRRQVAA